MSEISENPQVANTTIAAAIPADTTLTHSNSLMDNLHNQTNLDEQSRCEDITQISPALDHIRICLVGTVVDDKQTLAAAKKFNVPIVTSETGSELIDDHSWTTFFILNDFEGPLYEAIYKTKHKIIGPPALQQAAELNDGLSYPGTRPIFNNSMRGVITCFTGIRKKDELTRLVHLIHSMGGSIRKDMTSKVTHLICNSSGGEKYRYAMTFRLAVVRPEWVVEAWKRRNDAEFRATEDDFTKLHRLKPFEGQRICFFGFPTEEHQHMEDVLRTNGGIPTQIDDPDCSHVVVDDHYVQSRPDFKTAKTNNKTHIVKADWFWYTIQNGFADELEYLFEDYLESIANTPAGGDRRDSLPISFNKRKRKRISLRVPIEGTPLGAGKRRSSVSDAGLLSMSGSFLDCTTSPDKHEGSKNLIDVEKSLEQNAKSMTMRHNHFMDFFHTESNYVGILDTIVTLFKEPLEKMLETDAETALLNKSELKSVFSNFQPIYDVHKTMLNRLKEIQSNWTEDCLIGQIILDHSNDLTKAYPPYVNFFEQMKETLLLCDQQNPRFHAFLKICQAKPECGRQSLQDLMIRPVQRLPSISLLLNDIMKHTAKNNPDFKKLDDALKTIKEVMKHINEDKRKTEGQVVMFDIFNEIDNCPPHLVSSHRVYISRCEVTELSESLSGRGDSLMLFLFSDSIELCKKRSRVFSNAKSPSTTTLNALNTTRVQANKPYKHIKFMPLSSIRLVVDIRDSPRAFALNCRSSQDQKEKLYSFSISSEEEMDKTIYLKSLCKQLAENACKADADKFLVNVESDEIGIDVSDVNLGTLSKAFKFATRTRLKVGRAFSFNKTPSKLKRAVSTMMTSPFGSTNSLTPASQMAQMKLASCTNINEVGEDCESSSSSSPTSSQILTAPMSVQPVRKNKNIIPVAALRRI